MILDDRRREFAAFLERLASNDDGRDMQERWGELVVNHYSDEALEAVRRDVVRLRIAKPAGPAIYSPSESERLRAWANELRHRG